MDTNYIFSNINNIKKKRKRKKVKKSYDDVSTSITEVNKDELVIESTVHDVKNTVNTGRNSVNMTSSGITSGNVTTINTSIGTASGNSSDLIEDNPILQQQDVVVGNVGKRSREENVIESSKRVAFSLELPTEKEIIIPTKRTNLSNSNLSLNALKQTTKTLSDIDQRQQQSVLEALRCQLQKLEVSTEHKNQKLQNKLKVLSAVRNQLKELMERKRGLSGVEEGSRIPMAVVGGNTEESVVMKTTVMMRDIVSEMQPFLPSKSSVPTTSSTSSAPTYYQNGIIHPKNNIDTQLRYNKSTTTSSTDPRTTNEEKEKQHLNSEIHQNKGDNLKYPISGLVGVTVVDAMWLPLPLSSIGATGVGDTVHGREIAVFVRICNNSLLPVFNVHIGVGQEKSPLSSRPAMMGMSTTSGREGRDKRLLVFLEVYLYY